MLEFDEKTKALLEVAYIGADFVKRRRLNFEAVRPAVGDTILDLGCGNGFLSQELANAVGPTGRVIGVDPSTDMLESAKERCANSPQVELHQGFADAIPLPPGGPAPAPAPAPSSIDSALLEKYGAHIMNS